MHLCSRPFSLENIQKLAKSLPKLLALSITGGEPFLRRDLSKIVKAFPKSGYLKSINIVSNGYQTKQICEGIKNILSDLSWASNAPAWTEKKINNVTKSWFKYLR